MATGESFLHYVLDNIPDRWAVRSRKMFGEYMIYLNDKPVLLIWRQHGLCEEAAGAGGPVRRLSGGPAL